MAVFFFFRSSDLAELQEMLTVFVFAGVVVLLMLTLILNGVTLLLIYTLKISVDVLRKTVSGQTRLIEYVGRTIKEVK